MKIENVFINPKGGKKAMMREITCDEFIAEMRWYVDEDVLSDDALEVIFDYINESQGRNLELTEEVKNYIADVYREVSIWDLLERLEWLLDSIDNADCMPADILALLATDELYDSNWRPIIGETARGLVYLDD